LDPDSYLLYQNLASIQLHSGQVADARRTCELAITKHKDPSGVHDVLLQTLYLQQDDAGVESQLAWAHANGDPLTLSYDEIAMSLSQGRLRHARELIDEMRKRDKPPADLASYRMIVSVVGMLLADEGLTADSLSLLKEADEARPDPDTFVALAEDGHVAEAAAGLQKAMESHHEVDTLWRKEEAPEAQAAILLAQNKPREAITALEPARDFDGNNFLPAYLRGKAFSELGKHDLAIAEFKKITERQFIDPLLNEYPLAILELARSYARDGDAANARETYSRLLRIWAHADPDFPQLLAARAELASLGTGAAPH
jgi:tetratricopeptide (TPR) repeat protein